MRLHTHTITWSSSFIYLILHKENRHERRKASITLLQVKTNLTTSAYLTKCILFDRKIFRKNSPKNGMQFDQTSPKNHNPQQQKKFRYATKKTTQLCGKTTQLATLSSSKSAKMATLLATILCLLLRNCKKRIKQEFLDTDSVKLKTFAYYLWQI